MSWLEDLLRANAQSKIDQSNRMLGSVGKAVDVIGTSLGNPTPEFNLSENAEASGAAG